MQKYYSRHKSNAFRKSASFCAVLFFGPLVLLPDILSFFAKENCDELTRIRKQFLEALDGAGANYREKGAVENETKL